MAEASIVGKITNYEKNNELLFFGQQRYSVYFKEIMAPRPTPPSQLLISEVSSYATTEAIEDRVSRVKNTEEFINGPCWFLEDVTLRTGTSIIAVIGIFAHPTVMFVALYYWLFGDTDIIRSGGFALVSVNAILTPCNYILLMGSILENRWLCLTWILITVTFALVNVVLIIVFGSTWYFVIFQVVLICFTCYKLWVVVTFCVTLFKKSRIAKLQTKGRISDESNDTLDESQVVVIESVMSINSKVKH